MRAVAWWLTWTLAFRRRRLLVWNLLVPALLLVPVVTSAAAAAHRAVVVAVFVTFFGAYGSCIPLIRDGMTGWAEKVWLTGYGGRRWLIERTLASAAIDWVQLLPANLLLAMLIGTSASETLALLIATALALLFANLLGVVVATLVRALGEAALGCAVVSLFALHLSGVFRTPSAGSWWAIVEDWSPLRPLHETWVASLSSGPGLVVADGVLPALTLASLMLLAIAAGTWLARRVAATGSAA